MYPQLRHISLLCSDFSHNQITEFPDDICVGKRNLAEM